MTIKRITKKNRVDNAISKLECVDGFLQRLNTHGDNIHHADHYRKLINDIKFLVLQIS